MATAKDIKKVVVASKIIDLKTRKPVACPITGTAHKEVPKPKAIPKPQVKAKAVLKAKQEVKKTVPKPVPFKTVTIKTPREEFTEVLSIARDFVAKKGALPVLTHVLLKDKKITATDLDISWVKQIKCEGDISRCIPLEVVYKEVVALPDDITEVELTFTEKQVRINNRADIFTLPADEFPEIPKVKAETEYKIKVSDLKAVFPAIGEQDMRYTLMGAMLDLDKGRLSGTDGHRLHYNNISKGKGQYIIPRLAVQRIIKYGEDEVALSLNKTLLQANKLSGGTMTARLIEGQYPKIDEVIPKDKMPLVAKFKAEDFLKIMEGALPLAGKSKGVSLTFNGNLEIFALNADIGQYKWTIDCKYKGTLNFQIGFNADYLIDAVKAYPNETVTLEMSDPKAPCLINTQAVVMPIRI